MFGILGEKIGAQIQKQSYHNKRVNIMTSIIII